jgi:hypothetical protein
MAVTINYGVKTLESLSPTAVNTVLNPIKLNYAKAIETASKNSNVEPRLLYALMYVISAGKNLTPYKTNDKFVRQGIFGLSQKLAKQILTYEMQTNSMNPAEKDYLKSLDPAIASYLSDEKGTKTSGEHWQADSSTKLLINENKLPFNLMNPYVSAQIEAIWLGQLLDYYGKQTNNPVDKAFITMLLPSNQYGQMPLMAGNDWARNKPFTNDYLGKDHKILPNAHDSNSPYAIISPDSVRLGKYGVSTESVPPAIGFALREVFAEGGVLDNLYK